MYKISSNAFNFFLNFWVRDENRPKLSSWFSQRGPLLSRKLHSFDRHLFIFSRLNSVASFKNIYHSEGLKFMERDKNMQGSQQSRWWRWPKYRQWGYNPEGGKIDSCRRDGVFKGGEAGGRKVIPGKGSNFRKCRKVKEDRTGKYSNIAAQQYGQSFGWERALEVNTALGKRAEARFWKVELKA